MTISSGAATLDCVSRALGALSAAGVTFHERREASGDAVIVVVAAQCAFAETIMSRDLARMRSAPGGRTVFLGYDSDVDAWAAIHLEAEGARSPPIGAPVRRIARRGPSVALLAPDGAGKSTLAGELTRLSRFEICPIYMGLYGQDARRSRVPGIGFATRVLRMWRNHLRALRLRLRGSVVVFDRHPLDARLRPKRPSGRRLRVYRWILGHIVPTPELVIVLDAPSETLYARKQEQHIEELARQRGAYRELAGRLRCRTIILDADRPAAEVRRAATAVIWQECVAAGRARDGR